MVSSDQSTAPIDPSVPEETVNLVESKAASSTPLNAGADDDDKPDAAAVAPVIDDPKPVTLKGDGGEDKAGTSVERGKQEGGDEDDAEDVVYSDDDEGFPKFEGGQARGKVCQPVYGGIPGAARRPPRPGHPGPAEPKEKKKSWFHWPGRAG